jgi:CBS domain-containing protein
MKKVKHILQLKGRRVYSVPPQVKVYDAIRVMGENNIGSVLVIDEDGMVGILTERDYARKVVLQGRFSANTYVHEIMTPFSDMITVSPETDIDTCMELMTANRIRHLPVIENGVIAGMISIGDVVYQVITKQKEIIEDMTNYLYRR